MNRSIGIDLGTYNSAASFVSGGTVTMIKSKYGKAAYSKSFPSFVLFDYNGKKQLVGKLAKEQGFLDPKLLVWGVKRLVGLSYLNAERKGEFNRFKYEVEKGSDGSIIIKVGEERFSPTHILEFILREIKEDAQNPALNPLVGLVNDAVISVPAYFDATRVGPIKEAAKNAGFEEVSTIPEPTAAAIRYGLDLKTKSRILTFDIGAGTLDVTAMLLLGESLNGQLKCGDLCTSGNEALGGIDIDDALVKYLIDQYELNDLFDDLSAYASFRDTVEKVKIKLSMEQTASLSLPTMKIVDLTRVELESAIKPILEKCRGPIRVALRESGLTADLIDHVLFVGGPTNMPCIRATVKDELKGLGARAGVLEELNLWAKNGPPVDPMDCVAMGAALKAAGMIKHTSPDPFGYGTILGPVPGLVDYYYTIIPPNSSYPVKRTMGIVNYNPTARRIPITLVKKELHDDNGKTAYKYNNLGEFDCYIRSTGEFPEVDITLELTKDKVLVTTFTHKQTHEFLRLEKLGALKGDEVDLQEETPPNIRQKSQKLEDNEEGSESDNENEMIHSHFTPDYDVKSYDWTEKQMKKAIHVAGMLIDDFASKTSDDKVLEKKNQLQSIIKRAYDPKLDTPGIMDRIIELLNALTNVGVITEMEFRDYNNQLRAIERSP